MEERYESVCGDSLVNIHIRDEGDDPDPRVACRPPHRQHGLLHLSCIDDDAPNLIYFIALRYGKHCILY